MKNKKLLKPIVLALVVAALTLGNAACGSKSAEADENNTIRIGLSPSPHAAIVQQIIPVLEKEGIKVEIVEYTDYVIPNNALAEGEIDANYFQHIPYFEEFIASNKLDLENLGGVHIEPMGVFSKKIKSLDELKDGDEVMIPNDPTNAGRA